MTTDKCIRPGDGTGFRAKSGRILPPFAKVITLAKRIQHLRQTRDLLLPRLLSGQVELRTN